MLTAQSNLRVIPINTKQKYQVLIGENLLERSGELIKNVVNPCKTLIVTDDTVNKLYFETVKNSLEEQGFRVLQFVFKHGEKSKNLANYSKIINYLAQNEFTRTDLIVALGGGVTGDLAGFVGSTYLRGINLVQIPTTLLAQIDSSVGGKTAVDLKWGKNLVGAFYQPKLVICAVDTLTSLPDQVFTCGMGEVAKYAVLDRKVFNLIDNGNFELIDLVSLCVDYKRRIVEEDEFESGARKLLNLGHTPAHGIEKLSGYKISHGKAVAMGVKIILDASKKHGYIDRRYCFLKSAPDRKQ